ncbi:MAG: hypothetical protein ACOYOV_11240 [Bacteroidales bacterium]
MKRKILTLLAIIFVSICYSQTDTIFSNNQKISCSVKEITPEAVKYSYVGEDLINSIYKNTVQKIVFKSGRVQTFAEATSFKNIADVSDYENVSISQVESEVRGLFKVGDVSSKAKGTTTLSNQERVKERAYRKIKMQAAIMGANVIYITNQRSDGNKQGGYYQSGSSSETSLSGVAYTNQLPDFEEFKSVIKGRKNFKAVYEYKLYSSSSEMSEKSLKCDFTILKITNENGLIMLSADLPDTYDDTKFRVVSFDKTKFNIFYEDKNTVYNIEISL